MKKSLILILSLFVLFSCSWNEQKTNGVQSTWTETKAQEIENKKTIYTSFYPIYFITKSLLWEEANVINLVPAWWEPHGFEPTLKQIANMEKSNLIILNWLWMESYEEKLLEKFWTWKIILASESLNNLIQIDEEWEHKEEAHWHDHWNIDPHTWLSPKVYKEIASIIAVELEKAWFKNLDTNFLVKLDELEKNYRLWLQNCEVKKLVTSHEAFWYLARDYALLQHPVFGISPEEEPSAKDIANVVNLIKKEKLPYIFSEAFVSPKFTQTIKKETWVEILTLHTLESLSSDEEIAKEDYISIMKKNLEKLKVWLICK